MNRPIKSFLYRNIEISLYGCGFGQYIISGSGKYSNTRHYFTDSELIDDLYSDSKSRVQHAKFNLYSRLRSEYINQL